MQKPEWKNRHTLFPPFQNLFTLVPNEPAGLALHQLGIIAALTIARFNLEFLSGKFPPHNRPRPPPWFGNFPDEDDNEDKLFFPAHQFVETTFFFVLVKEGQSSLVKNPESLVLRNRLQRSLAAEPRKTDSQDTRRLVRARRALHRGRMAAVRLDPLANFIVIGGCFSPSGPCDATFAPCPRPRQRAGCAPGVARLAQWRPARSSCG